MAAGTDAARMSGYVTFATEIRGHGLKTSWRIRTALIFLGFSDFPPLVCGLRFLEASRFITFMCYSASFYLSEGRRTGGGVMCINSYGISLRSSLL